MGLESEHEFPTLAKDIPLSIGISGNEVGEK
jgi:hypothetical protein